MSLQPLFTPLRMGDLDLPNRIVMAPLTRMRAGSMDHVPTALQAEYYAQRGSAGLIVAEATAISADGFGYAVWWTPFFGQKKIPSLDRAAALKMKESQCLKFARVTHPV